MAAKRYPLPKKFNAALSEKAYANLRRLNDKYHYGNNYLLTILLENLDEVSSQKALDKIRNHQAGMSDTGFRCMQGYKGRKEPSSRRNNRGRGRVSKGGYSLCIHTRRGGDSSRDSKLFLQGDRPDKGGEKHRDRKDIRLSEL